VESIGPRGKRAFAFDTKVRTRSAASVAKRIEKELKRVGATVVIPHSSAAVKGREGPVEEGMEEMFRQTAAEIAKSLQ